MNCLYFIVNASNIISSKCRLCMMYAYVFVLWIWVHRCHRTHVQVRAWKGVSYSSVLSMPDLLAFEFLISCNCLSTPGGDEHWGYYYCATDSNSYLALRYYLRLCGKSSPTEPSPQPVSILSKGKIVLKHLIFLNVYSSWAWRGAHA